jgi:hypothetical protein
VIGTRISLRRQTPYGVYLCLASFIGIVALSFAVRELAAASVLPFAIALALLFSPERHFLARFTTGSLELARPAQSIRYSDLREVHPLAPFDKARPTAFPIWLVYAGGALLIPAPLTVSSERVYAFLRSQLPETGRALPEPLERYRREQAQAFGADRVFACCGRRAAPRPLAAWRVIGYAIAVTGLIWAIIPLLRANSLGWAIAGVTALLAGGAVSLAGTTNEGKVPMAGGATGLVISPLGIAMQHENLSGHLAWQEIQKIGVRRRHDALRTSRAPAPAIVLEVSGASVDVPDVYDRPLAEIHEQVLRYWK